MLLDDIVEVLLLLKFLCASRGLSRGVLILSKLFVY